MAKITALKARGGKLEVWIDGALAFNVSAEVAGRLSLSVGQFLSADEIKELADTESFGRCLSIAMRLLGYRPRSRAELRWRLLERGFPATLVDGVLALLEQRGLIDDRAFARYWADNRVQFKPRSARLIALELKRKGVSAEVVDEAMQALDDEMLAYRAGLRKARSLDKLSGGKIYQRLYDYLRRRGFAEEVIRSVLKRLRESRVVASDRDMAVDT